MKEAMYELSSVLLHLLIPVHQKMLEPMLEPLKRCIKLNRFIHQRQMHQPTADASAMCQFTIYDLTFTLYDAICCNFYLWRSMRSHKIYNSSERCCFCCYSVRVYELCSSSLNTYWGHHCWFHQGYQGYPGWLMIVWENDHIIPTFRSLGTPRCLMINLGK